MNASSESGLWATVISRTAVETDEEDIFESYNTLALHADSIWPCPDKKIFIFTGGKASPDETYEPRLNTVKLFLQVPALAAHRSLDLVAAADEAVASASAAATALRQPRPQWPQARAPAEHTKPSSALRLEYQSCTPQKPEKALRPPPGKA